MSTHSIMLGLGEQTMYSKYIDKRVKTGMGEGVVVDVDYDGQLEIQIDGTDHTVLLYPHEGVETNDGRNCTWHAGWINGADVKCYCCGRWLQQGASNAQHR